MQPPDREAAVDRLRARCHAAGVPLTAQRRAVLAILASRCDHPTAEQIHAALLERMPEASRATVYRALELLGEHGLVRRIEHPGPAVRFDAKLERHHHFLCTRCGSLEDLPLDAVEGYGRLRFAGAAGGVEHELALFVRGTCALCAAS